MIWDSVNIGLTNRCNASCGFCPVKNTQVKREDMSLPMFESIIRQIKDQVKSHVSLALFGESTLHPNFNEMVVLAKKHIPVPLVLYTNLIKIDNCVEGLNMLDRVTISIDATNRAEYIKTKGRDRYEKVLENILKVKTKTVAQFAFLQYASKPKKPRGASMMKLGRYISWGGEVDWNSPAKRKTRDKTKCGYLDKNMFIASNGDIVICCIDYNHQYVAGNVQNESLQEIWQGERMQYLRENHTQFKMCINCETEV